MDRCWCLVAWFSRSNIDILIVTHRIVKAVIYLGEICFILQQLLFGIVKKIITSFTSIQRIIKRSPLDCWHIHDLSYISSLVACILYQKEKKNFAVIWMQHCCCCCYIRLLCIYLSVSSLIWFCVWFARLIILVWISIKNSTNICTVRLLIINIQDFGKWTSTSLVAKKGFNKIMG